MQARPSVKPPPPLGKAVSEGDSVAHEVRKHLLLNPVRDEAGLVKGVPERPPFVEKLPSA